MSGGEKGASGDEEAIVQEALSIVMGVSAIEEAVEDFDPALRRGAELSDFNDSLVRILPVLRARLDSSVAGPLGFRIGIRFDADTQQLDEDVAYDGAFKARTVDDSGGNVQLEVTLYPGALAIDELTEIIEEYDESGLFESEAATTATQLYIASLVTKAYVAAIGTYSLEGGITPVLADKFRNFKEYLDDPDIIEDKIRLSEFSHLDILSEYIRYLPSESILRINQHRLAAGIILRSLGDEKEEAIVADMRSYLVTFLSEPQGSEVNAMRKLVDNVDRTDIDSLLEARDDKKDNASYLSLQIIGFAFPMGAGETDALVHWIDKITRQNT